MRYKSTCILTVDINSLHSTSTDVHHGAKQRRLIRISYSRAARYNRPANSPLYVMHSYILLVSNNRSSSFCDQRFDVHASYCSCHFITQFLSRVGAQNDGKTTAEQAILIWSYRNILYIGAIIILVYGGDMWLHHVERPPFRL